MKIVAEKAVSQQGKEYTKVVAILENFKDPAKTKEMFASMSDEAKEQFAEHAVDDNGRLAMMIDEFKSEMGISCETVKTPDKTWVATRLYFKTLVPIEWVEKKVYKNIFEIREALGRQNIYGNSIEDEE